MEFGLFNLRGRARPKSRRRWYSASEVAEQTKLADELGYTIA